MASNRRQLLSLLFMGGAYALFPDCVNGPLKNETICDASACKLSNVTIWRFSFSDYPQHRSIELEHLSHSTLWRRRSMPPEALRLVSLA
jgi:hypothetical protein